MSRRDQKHKSKDFVKILGLGPLQLELSLCLNKQQAEQYKIKLRDIKSIGDCKDLLEKEKKIHDMIGVKSMNTVINSLLYINKVTKRKSFIEYLLLCQPVYEFPFMSSIVQYVTEQNYLFFIENDFFSFPSRVNFTIKILGHNEQPIESKSFNLCPDMNNPGESITNINLYDRFNCDFSSADYFILDLNEIFKLNCVTDISILIEFFERLAETYNKLKIITILPYIVENFNHLPSEFIKMLDRLLFITDVFIMEREETLSLIEFINSTKEDKFHHKRNIDLYFIKEIKNCTNKSKTGIIIDRLKTITIINQLPHSKLISFHSTFDFDFFPCNISEVLRNDYRKLTNVHLGELNSIMIGGLLSQLVYDKSFDSCFKVANELLKRAIELFRFGLEFPIDEEFYEIPINQTKKNMTQDNVSLYKEKNFVLDCINKQTSRLKEYNSLHDRNLAKYFSSLHVKQHLRRVGFVNEDSNILIDPDKRLFSITTDRRSIKDYQAEVDKFMEITNYNENVKLQIKGICSNIFLRNPVTNQKRLPSLTKEYTSIYKKQSSAKHVVKSRPKLKPLNNKSSMKILSENEIKLKSNTCK